MRVGDWKILAHLSGPDPELGADIRPEDTKLIKTAELTTFELYNLRRDIGETTDLADREPERLKAMSDRLRKLYREVRDESPVWPEWEWPRYEGKRIRAAREAAARAAKKDAAKDKP
jgi:arylsulfatase A